MSTVPEMRLMNFPIERPDETRYRLYVVTYPDQAVQ